MSSYGSFTSELSMTKSCDSCLYDHLFLNPGPFLSSIAFYCIPPVGLTSACADPFFVRRFVLAAILILIRYLNEFLILEVLDKTKMAMF